MDVKWSQTEGIVIENLAASGARIVRSDDLLADLSAYHRYPVDPIRGSPTFQQLAEVDEGGDVGAAERHDEIVRDAAARPLRISVHQPAGRGPYAMLVAVKIAATFGNKVGAFEAQADVSSAFESFADAMGNALFESRTPVHVEYSPYRGSYGLGGSLLAIVHSPDVADLDARPGVQEISAVGSIHAAFVPWNEARYEVVLHFFSDPMDSRGDSKRLLTKPLGLAEIFDLEAAQAGNRNAMAAGFADTLRYARRCLVQRYGQSFTLDDQTSETAPFYLVVRTPGVSENFHLPRAWMGRANDQDELEMSEEDIYRRLSRLYDYGDRSRELAPEAFAAIFDPSVRK
jgi:hypothetical protein